MQAGSSLTEQQREHLIDLFEAGTGSRAAAHRLDASYDASPRTGAAVGAA